MSRGFTRMAYVIEDGSLVMSVCMTEYLRTHPVASQAMTLDASVVPNVVLKTGRSWRVIELESMLEG